MGCPTSSSSRLHDLRYDSLPSLPFLVPDDPVEREDHGGPEGTGNQPVSRPPPSLDLHEVEDRGERQSRGNIPDLDDVEDEKARDAHEDALEDTLHVLVRRLKPDQEAPPDPRCLRPAGVITRPLGVFSTSPKLRRYGSTSSSTASFDSPST